MNIWRNKLLCAILIHSIHWTRNIFFHILIISWFGAISNVIEIFEYSILGLWKNSVTFNSNEICFIQTWTQIQTFKFTLSDGWQMTMSHKRLCLCCVIIVHCGQNRISYCQSDSIAHKRTNMTQLCVYHCAFRHYQQDRITINKQNLSLADISNQFSPFEFITLLRWSLQAILRHLRRGYLVWACSPNKYMKTTSKTNGPLPKQCRATQLNCNGCLKFRVRT